MHELMAHLHGNLMALFDSKLRLYGHVDFSMEPMTYPSDPDLGYILNLRCMVHGVSDFINYLRINAIEDPG